MCGVRCRIEKYRPTRLSEVVGNEETISRLEVSKYASCHVHITSKVCLLQVFAKEGNVPNLIIAVSLHV